MSVDILRNSKRSMTRRSLPAYSPAFEQHLRKVKQDLLGAQNSKSDESLIVHSGEWITTKQKSNERLRRKSICMIGNERTAIISTVTEPNNIPLRRSRNHSTTKKQLFCFVEHSTNSTSTESLVMKAGSFSSFEILPDTSVLITFEHEEMYEYFYRDSFSSCDHWNWAGNTEKNEFFIFSVIKEPQTDPTHGKVYRAFIRSPSADKRMFIAELDKHIKDPKQKLKQFLKESFNLVEMKRIKSPKVINLLLQFEKKNVVEHSKFGILNRQDGQMNEDEMFNNQEISDDFREFLQIMGDEVLLFEFPRYRGGLDVRYNSTGSTSYFTEFNGLEIMYHVGPLLPHFQYDKQQVEKKRHLGNDLVVIVFDESGLPFDHSIISSQFNQIFAIVSPVIMPASQRKMYKLEMSCKPGIRNFGPHFPSDILFERGPAFKDLLLTKILNGERAACTGPAFMPKIRRTRNQLLEEIIIAATKH